MLRQILVAVRQIVRNKQGGALPKDVHAWISLECDEVTVRRYMVQLWRSGLLFRIDWNDVIRINTRKGYRIPTLAERLCFQITGVWPFAG